MVGLGDLDGGIFDSTARDVSGDGSVIVGRGATDVGYSAFVWYDGYGMYDLREALTEAGADLTGWILREAYGVSEDGSVIVGWGINPQGKAEAWRAELCASEVVPEPAALLIWSALVAPVAVFCLRRRSAA